MYKIAVVICTYNPNLAYLNRVFDALKTQTFCIDDWELLVIDNNSDTPLSKIVDVSWHPGGRIILESNLGTSIARARGITEANAGLILFVDDDNCLKSNYLQTVSDKFKQNKMIGVLGAGKVIAQFETEPSAEVLPYTHFYGRFDARPIYSNAINCTKAIPFGAGMAIKKSLASNYVDALKKRSPATFLGRVGRIALAPGEDDDIALHACEKGYLTGVIPELEILHLIPAWRVQPAYIIKAAAGMAYSHYMLGKLWGYLPDYPENKLLKRTRYLKQIITLKGLTRKVFIARYKATEEAKAVWNKAVASGITSLQDT